MTLLRTAVAAAAILLAGCQSAESNTAANSSESGQEAQIAPILDTPEAKDSASYARPLEARVYHVALDLGVDFEAKRIGGTATLDIDRKPDAKEIVLDDKGLEIQSITDGSDQPLDYKVGAADEKLGSPLAVALRPDTKRLVIKYQSAKDAGALQWLTPEQTAGKKKPYLFSQGQAIENRSWIPTQDSPGIRQSWEAPITAPGRPHGGDERCRSPPSRHAGRRERLQLQDAPPRRAVPDRDRRRRPRVQVAGQAHRRLDRAGDARPRRRRTSPTPRRWSRRPRSSTAPTAGAATTCSCCRRPFRTAAWKIRRLTFLTPTFIAGDKSLDGLVAHELAHCWSGNLVTNATWSDSWLNEGVTSYFENRIMEEIYGPKRASRRPRSASTRCKALAEKNGPNTQLHLDAKRACPTAEQAASSTTRAPSSSVRSRKSSVARSGMPICAPISIATPSSR